MVLSSRAHPLWLVWDKAGSLTCERNLNGRMFIKGRPTSQAFLRTFCGKIAAVSLWASSTREVRIAGEKKTWFVFASCNLGGVRFESYRTSWWHRGIRATQVLRGCLGKAATDGVKTGSMYRSMCVHHGASRILPREDPQQQNVQQERSETFIVTLESKTLLLLSHSFWSFDRQGTV